MAAAERRVKSQKMVADLQKRGYYHGKRMSSPCHYNYPTLGDIGSAAYRRLMKKRGTNKLV